jgi:hypothetical protein
MIWNAFALEPIAQPFCVLAGAPSDRLELFESSAAVATNVCAMCCSLRACGGLLEGNRAGSLAEMLRCVVLRFEKDITRARGCA